MRVLVWLVMAAAVWLHLSGCATPRPAVTDDVPPLQMDDRVLIVSADTVTPVMEFDKVGAGGVAGGFQVAGTEQVQCLVSGLDSALASARPNEQLALALQRRLKEYSNVDLPVRKEATEPGDALYPKLLLVDADGKRSGSDDQATIVLKATLLRKKSDGTVRSFGNIDHFLRPRPLAQWCGLSREELQRELLEGLTALSQRMSDELLVAKELDLPSARTCPSYRGLAPVAPPVNTALPGRPLPAPVDTLRPVLRWEPFPRLVDMAKSPIVPAVAGAIVYDLRVWQHDEDAPAGRTPVYAKTGLRGTRHRVETALKTGTTYAWEVRPRFYLNGVRRALPWSRLTYHVEECALAAPDESLYLFETPVAGK